MKPKYLFVCREGSTDVFTTDSAPTPHDIETIGTGLLDIIRLEDLHRLNSSGVWESIKAGIITNVVIEGEDSGPFHAAAGSDENPAIEERD
jgi:hypothetical protein